MASGFQLVGRIEDSEVIAVASAIRELRRLNKHHGKGRWRKLKGIATVRLADGTLHRAEVHWYEAHGVGKQELKLKRILD